MIGIGGIGMSGIAQLLVTSGREVTGSDQVASPAVSRLRAAGVQVSVGHAAGQIGDPDLVIVSSAVPSENPEVVEARRRHIPMAGRGAVLAALAGAKRTVAVVGSHGKTTTSAMVACVLADLGLDPTAVIGGYLDAFGGGNTRQGRGPFMVVEADESDGSFLHLAPEVAVVTNLDDEHVEAYADIDGLERAFARFAERVAPAGRVVACADDVRLRRLVTRLSRPVTTYGIDHPASVRARAVELSADGSRSRVTVGVRGGAEDVTLSLAVPGRHNLLNALGALAVASWLGVAPAAAAKALGRFAGVQRRFQRYRLDGDIELVDDYGHHPTEIAAVLDTIRLTRRRIVVLFQPHRYSRTARLCDRFGAVLATADVVVLTEVYAAGEPPRPGADAAGIAASIRRHATIPVELARDPEHALDRVAGLVSAGDTVIVLGAGSVGQLVPRLAARLGRGA